MPFDLAADPWGAAMLGTAGLWVLSLLVVVFAHVAGTSRRLGGRLMLLSVIGFLGTVAGGTWERIQRGDAARDQPPPAEPIVIEAADPPHDTGDDTGDDTRGDAADGSEAGLDTGAGTGEATGDAATEGDGTATGDPMATAGDEGTGDGGAAETGTDEPAPDLKTPDAGLPTDPEAREAEIRTILRDTATVADGRGCASLEDVAGAWTELRRLASVEPRWRSKADDVAERLERCRRKLLYSISRKYRRTQIDEREAWVASAVEKFEAEHGLSVAVALSGKSHERLRIGGTGLDAAKADTLMDGGLRGELQALGFAHVVLSDGKVPRTYELEVTPEGELGLPDLQAVGLGEPLSLP